MIYHNTLYYRVCVAVYGYAIDCARSPTIFDHTYDTALSNLMDRAYRDGGQYGRFTITSPPTWHPLAKCDDSDRWECIMSLYHEVITRPIVLC